MKQLLVPGTDLLVSRLTFGTASIHHLHSSAKRQSLVSAAYDVGFTHFDTAPYYGLGIAEQEMGRFLATHKNATVATKIGLYPAIQWPPSTVSVYLQKALGKLIPGLSRPRVNWNLQKCEASLHTSLRRLRTGTIDILFLHEPTAGTLPAEELHFWLNKQRAAGKIRYWGLAGSLDKYESLVARQHSLAQIIQMQDSVQFKQSEGLKKWGRAPQFTYGYLSSRTATQSPLSLLKEAFSLNTTGSVLVSSRQVERVTKYPELLDLIERGAHN